MRATETVLKALLQGDRQYLVPLYQRAYSWRRENLNRLWVDILRVLDSEEQDGHFLGSIVLAPSPQRSASGVQCWLVVDGQQRVTTLSILLCAIRDHCELKLPTLARKINVQYLMNEFAESSERYTLLPTQADRASWVNILEKSPEAGGEDGVGDAYRFFKGCLEGLIDPDADDLEGQYQKLEQAVASRLNFVEISAHPDDNVYRIFESLNNTGMKLTQADLLRNYVFMRLPRSAEKIYTHHWLPIQRMLSDTQLVNLIWLDVLLRDGRRATQHSIYQDQQRYLSKFETEDEVGEWVVRLHGLARIFRRVLKPSLESDVLVRKALDRLLRWRSNVVYPICVKTLMAFDARRINSREASAILRVVESYLVRQLIVGVRRAGNNVMMSDLIGSLSDEEFNAETVTRILSRQRNRFPTDSDLRQAMLEQPFYWRGKEWHKLFILRCLEEASARGEVIDFENSKVTIEHVMPQSTTLDWEAVLAECAQSGECAEEALSPAELHAQFVHTIGNLTLSAYNGTLSNKKFEEKREILANSGLFMNVQISRESRWGIAQIKERGEFLAELAIEIWPGPDGSPPDTLTNPKVAILRQVLSEIPAGRWTNYQTLAQAAGTNRKSVSKWLADYDLPNSHRVLKSDGSLPARLSKGLSDPEEQMSRLMSEGILFGVNDKAHGKYSVDARGLTTLVEQRLEGAEGEDCGLLGFDFFPKPRGGAVAE
ncbi:GmrSD restriction endonuclease domain-containing protein [Streptomyces sp. BI20]|uniref:GmrSD restriction endonuclease domain-containing protein n=1 Tax=Streptomyces sp. BI20 TaxID=3403460 RepID=UPI003C753AA0